MKRFLALILALSLLLTACGGGEEKWNANALAEQTAALLLEKNSAKAAAIRNDFEKIARSYPYPHEIDAERELMQIADQKIKTKEC